MKRFVQTAFVLLSMLCFAGLAIAQEKATKEECMAKCKEASKLVKKIGLEAAAEKISDKNGAFVWKDTYVFCIDLDTAKTIAHINPKLLDKPLIGLKDVNGKMFFLEFITVAKEKGDGWVDYMWPKPGEKTPSLKSTYVYRVPGENVLVAAGIYQ